MTTLKAKDNSKKILKKYQEYLSCLERKTYTEKEKDVQKDPHKITYARILHYKADILLSLITDIIFGYTIRFDTFSSYFDFSFIENSLIGFSMDERFQIFEVLLKTYIQQLKKISEKEFSLAYYSKDLEKVLDMPRSFDCKEAIEEYKKRTEKLPLLESLFSKQGFVFQEALDYLTFLNINEHFAHFFLEFLQEKYQNKKRKALKFTKYYFEDNPDFIYYVRSDNNMANYLDNLYLNTTGNVNFNEKESAQLHYEIFRLLEGKDGENYLGYYTVIYHEMCYVKEYEAEIFSFLLKVLFNDISYVTQRKNNNKYSFYQKLQEVLNKNFSLQQLVTPNQDEVRNMLISLDFPVDYVDAFINRLAILYYNRMPKEQSVSKKGNVIPTPISEPSFQEKNEPLIKEDDYQVRIETYLESLCDDEEKKLLLLAKNALCESNSSFKGYRELIHNNMQNLLDIAREMMENQQDYDFYMELFLEEMKVLKESLEQFQLIADYIPKRIPNKS